MGREHHELPTNAQIERFLEGWISLARSLHTIAETFEKNSKPRKPFRQSVRFGAPVKE